MQPPLPDVVVGSAGVSAVVVGGLSEVIDVTKVVLGPVPALVVAGEDAEVDEVSSPPPGEPAKNIIPLSAYGSPGFSHREGVSIDSPPGPETVVVRVPLSMYTPDQYRSSVSSGYPSLGSSSTPTCQSAPLLLVLALMGATV